MFMNRNDLQPITITLGIQFRNFPALFEESESALCIFHEIQLWQMWLKNVNKKAVVEKVTFEFHWIID